MHKSLGVNMAETEQDLMHNGPDNLWFDQLVLSFIFGKKVLQISIWHEFADKVEPAISLPKDLENTNKVFAAVTKL